MKTKTAKIATCTHEVPSCLNPANKVIKVGEKIEFLKTKFRNGEGHLVLVSGKTVPDVFFDF